MGRIGPFLPELPSLFPYTWSAGITSSRAKSSIVTHQERPYNMAEEAEGACILALIVGVPDYPRAHSNRVSLKRVRQEKVTKKKSILYKTMSPFSVFLHHMKTRCTHFDSVILIMNTLCCYCFVCHCSLKSLARYAHTHAHTHIPKSFTKFSADLLH